MANSIYTINLPHNEPVKTYAPGSNERKELQSKLLELKNQQLEIPLIINGKEIKTGNTGTCILPHNHQTVIGTYHKSGEKEIALAIESGLKAQHEWLSLEWQDRVSVFLKAAELLAGPRRQLINAACMLCQSKNPFQAEIDAACELTDFFRFNAYHSREIFCQQPPHNPFGTWNRLEYRPLEGFVFAVTPFNFLSIAGNLPTAPAMLGNVSLWKPASSSVYSAYYIMKILQEAGLPDGVINFIPGDGRIVGPIIMNSPHLAGVHFTGSTNTFQNMWSTISDSIRKYKNYPRIVGETGGKNFIIAHTSANLEALGTAIIRGAFEYQGQKCSAVSRVYIPKKIWSSLKDFLIDQLETIKIGDVEDFSNFMNAVIDKKAFQSITHYIENAKASNEATILYGGTYDDSIGYYIKPTIIVTNNPHFVTMEEEIFGPVVTVYVYDEKNFVETLKICNETSSYSLTGAIFSQDRYTIQQAEKALFYAAGNFYINDKPTGAVVGQQPFGGSRLSGTNDKAGSILNLIRWLSPRTIKENHVPSLDYRYPFLQPDE